MEIRLFLGKIPHTFIVSKFIKRFIIPLEEISQVLGNPNNFEVMKVNRSGKLFNFIIETDNPASAAIVEVKEDTSLRFHAKNRGSFGFSSFVACFPEEKVSKGVITLIAKRCDKPDYTGYYLNSFWGYPVEPEPFTPNLDYGKMKESAKFWENKAYRCEGRAIDLSQILIPYAKYIEYRPEDFEDLEHALGTHLSFIGRCDLSETFQQTLIAPEGHYAVLRGIHV
jgi:hypothetical protein